RLFAGAKYGLLEQGISWVTDLDQACMALYLDGVAGTGKSLLAKGLAQLWSDAPTTLDQAMGGFNDGLVSCPLVFADETLPKDSRGNTRTEDLREFVQADRRPLRRK